MDSEIFKLLAEIELEHWWFVARRRIVRAVLAAVLPPGALVVDVGCGTGANIASLADRYEVAGIDTTQQAIDLARQRFDGVRYICGSAPRDLGDLRERVDAVMLMDVLEHVPDDAAVLRPIVDSLRPGALLLITVPANVKLWSPHDEAFSHFRRYDAQTFRDVWKSMPVREVMVSHFCARLYPLVRLIRWYVSRTGTGWGRAGSDLSVPARPVNRVLQRVFEGESRRLVDLVRGRRSRGFARGVSLIAVLERTADRESNNAQRSATSNNA